MRSYSFQYGIRGGKRAFPGFGAEQRDFNHCLPRTPACTGRKRPPISRRRKPPEGSHDHSYGHVQAASARTQAIHFLPYVGDGYADARPRILMIGEANHGTAPDGADRTYH